MVAEIIISILLGAAIAAVANAGSGAAIALAAVLGLFAIVLYVAIPIVYFGYMEGQPSGQTFGKRALGIRVVGLDTAVAWRWAAPCFEAWSARSFPGSSCSGTCGCSGTRNNTPGTTSWWARRSFRLRPTPSRLRLGAP